MNAPLANGRAIVVREAPLANDIGVWEVREVYFINSGIINSYFSYEYHAYPLILCLCPPPLPLSSANFPLAAAALVSLIVSLPGAPKVLELEAIAVPDVTSLDPPLAAISFALLFFARSMFLLAF